jgi:hypothetical protein
MFKKIIRASLIASALYISGCSLFLGQEKAKSLDDLMTVTNKRANGVTDYYTQEEKAQLRIGFEADMKRIKEIREKYSKEYEK